METRCIRCGSRIAAGTRTCAGCGWQAEWAETFLFALTPAEGRMLEALQEIAQTALTETEEIMRPVIGFDFGNYNSYVCFVSDPEPGTIREGVIRDLVPDKLPGGIPSVFYHSRRKGTHVGEAADRMKPVRNQMRYLKLHLGEQVELDGDTISCDDAVVQVAQHCLQKACREMQNEFRQTTNLVALAYPARYNQAQRNRLIELIEQTETEDGQPFRVVGTIMEPAAASLSYLYENSAGEGGDAAPDREVAALAFDVGGGTFDLSLLRLYPAGRERADGSRYNYEILDRGGILDLGGKDFDRVLLELLLSSLRSDAGRRMRDEVQEQVERIKRHLTDHDRAFAQVYDDDEEDYVD
ncbi:MAG: Hsp70 family protein, partial [Mogibacterium sp.]|nr:Hsp70 family protein [Mogibacterium sp.]